MRLTFAPDACLFKLILLLLGNCGVSGPEFALRAAQEAKGGDAFPFLRRYFEAVAMAQVGRSAEHAREIGYLRPSDRVVMNRFELLAVAKAEARAMAEAGYRPPLKPRDIPVLGRSAAATIKAFQDIRVHNVQSAEPVGVADRCPQQKAEGVLAACDRRTYTASSSADDREPVAAL
jgi:hypothetical protein